MLGTEVAMATSRVIVRHMERSFKVHQIWPQNRRAGFVFCRVDRWRLAFSRGRLTCMPDP